MTKKKNQTKKITKAELNKSFDHWNETLDAMKEQADKSYMFLLGKLFEYGKEIVEMYRKAYTVMYEKQQEK